MSEIVPFKIQIPDAELDDLRERLRRTRWPVEETVDDWSQGVPLAYLKRLCAYWAEEYDWRSTEARLNELSHFRTDIDGLGIHFVHVRSPYASAMPLIITNGWPGSMTEYLKVVGPLTDPVAHGGAAADAFHVVIPSIPGYGFSDKPTSPGWNVERVAGAWAALMARLGYDRYGAQGSDWGTSISSSLGQQDLEHLAGIHLTPPIAAPDPATFDDLSEAEKAALAALKNSQEWESGYSGQHSTRPQTLGYGLTDSPVGLCAWIVEKFRAWMDCDGRPEKVLTDAELLDNVMLYWLTGSATSSIHLYWESFKQVWEWFNKMTTDTVTAPTGCSIFPKDVPRPSRRWAAKRYTDIRYWNELDKGGHFAALEQPDLFVNEVRSFFRLVS